MHNIHAGGVDPRRSATTGVPFTYETKKQRWWGGPTTARDYWRALHLCKKTNMLVLYILTWGCALSNDLL